MIVETEIPWTSPLSSGSFRNQSERARALAPKKLISRVVFGAAVGEDGGLLGAASMSFKVIDGDGPGREERDRERQREWAKDEFAAALRELAANMLRVVRGAGKGYELLLQMKAVIDSAVKYRDLHDYWPSSDLISNVLMLEDEMETTLERGRGGTLGQVHIDRWLEDGTFDEMSAEHTLYRGVLQIIASRLIGQNTQERAGDSEFHEGLRRLEDIREKRRRKFLEQQRASRPAHHRSAPKKRKLTPRKPPGDGAL
jgi:hypothetical protein